MASSSKIAKGLHLIKLRPLGGTASVTLPAEVRAEAGLDFGFVGVRAVGELIVLCKITDVTEAGAGQQSIEAIDRAMRQWQRDRAEEYSNGKEASEKSAHARG